MKEFLEKIKRARKKDLVWGCVSVAGSLALLIWFITWFI